MTNVFHQRSEIKDDDSGELVSDLFFELQSWPALWPDEPKERTKRAIESLAPVDAISLQMESMGERWEKLFECPTDKEHATRSRLASMKVFVRSGDETPVVPLLSDTPFVVREDILAALGKAGLSGLRGVKCNVVRAHGVKPERTYYVLCIDGKDMARMPIVVPKESDKCPFCANGPVICPGCGELRFTVCPKCKKRCVMYRGDKDDPELVAPILFQGTPDLGCVLDASRWDGTDFLCCRGVFAVTRRVVDALVSMHAYAFRALPLRTYIGSCAAGQRADLDKLRTRR